jgi:hypothetical protein
MSKGSLLSPRATHEWTMETIGLAMAGEATQEALPHAA